MLGAQGIIPADDAAAIDAGLAAIAEEMASGDVRLPPRRRGHPHRRRAAADRARRRRRPPPAHRAQPQRPGRSPTRSCYLRERSTAQIDAAARAGRRAARPGRGAPRHAAARATPTASAPSRCAWPTTCWPTSGCSTATASRLGHAIEATADCPLGSGALSGVGFPIDREADRGGARLRPPEPQQPRRGRQPRRPRRLPALRGPARRAPLAPRCRDRGLGRRRVRLRRARRRLHLGLLDAPPEEEPRRGRARARQGAAPGGRPRRPPRGALRACRSPTTRTCRRTRSTCSTRSTRSTCSCPR